MLVFCFLFPPSRSFLSALFSLTFLLCSCLSSFIHFPQILLVSPPAQPPSTLYTIIVTITLGTYLSLPPLRVSTRPLLHRRTPPIPGEPPFPPRSFFVLAM
ncbi:hypothetical protein QBC46DRAFT_378535 [Diplogelasinospora grovesii]|uniref:Uncharacterized protein n=1 Tax=Diplogelasinospora grovesii TaxID=303347 RepID=A0AAN6ND02_9PEZI|nr:hypothetical protein QBC46DRAFT_378535 [Diplogelasinospora grovesii]